MAKRKKILSNNLSGQKKNLITTINLLVKEIKVKNEESIETCKTT